MEKIMNQIPYLDLINPPAQEPVSLAEVKLALRVDGNADDGHIQNLIKAARVMAEEYLRRALVTQTWQLQYDLYAPSVVNLPRGPIQSISFVKVINSEWVETTISESAYYLNAGKEALVFDAAPMGQIVQIQYVTGYGLPANVPEPIRQGIITHVLGMYQNRMDNRGVPDASLSLYNQYRSVKL
jgi:uncharacterized phiE125 gp8 family phage protein